ncbi:hypothetical protein BKA61DRAFT_619022 [Leptodontidium sp. MPI-SDFR-AT-0119]|nr:hypothetical protein BKA61DRAFT_619022 [Leptodontidium sp. MPI-SDFR-AT-0119]
MPRPSDEEDSRLATVSARRNKLPQHNHNQSQSTDAQHSRIRTSGIRNSNLVILSQAPTRTESSKPHPSIFVPIDLMADQPSLTAAMDNLSLVQGTSHSLPTGQRPPQSLPPRPPQSSIMAKWEHDRFGMNSNSRANPTIRRGVEQQERSTVSSWRDFAQSHTSKPLPPPRGRNVGNSYEDAWRNESRRVDGGDESTEPRASVRTLPTLSTKPTLPVVPLLGQERIASQGRSPPTVTPQSPLTMPASPQAIPRNQALHKRKSEKNFGKNGDISTEEPQPKRASPDRPSPLSAAFGRNDRGAAAGASTPENQPRTSSLNPTPPISRPQSPSFAPKTTPRITPPTPGGLAALSLSSSLPKSRGKTTDDMARRMIFAAIGAGRVPKRTEEELKKRQEEQERRRVQREEREKLGKEEIMKWGGIHVVNAETKPATQVIAREDLIKPTATRSSVNELTQLNGEDIQW